ncbi:MAG: hypothetical protein KKC19_00825 [Nanoarchaeota archaeon]|nr:hypothetical protein [Nanoarchaeota archaeon]
MENEKVINKIKEIKNSFNELKKKHHSEGEKEFESLRDLIKRIIDRIYPEKDAKDLKNRLIHKSWVITGNERDEYWQDFYQTKIDLSLRVINTILEEYYLFKMDTSNALNGTSSNKIWK